MYTAPLPCADSLQALRSGQIDLIAYINDICERIERTEAHIEALVPERDRRGRLLKEAEELQRRFPTPETRPALYGVLVGVKDMFMVDGFMTRAGSRLPSELFTGPEAVCVRRLREAGALVLGMTVATEFAYFEPGPTRNPHQPEHTPGGSSSGSAAAVAAGYCQLALGTQTSGSTIRPAAYCGLIGFKPSYGRIPTEGLIFCAPTLDTVGYLTQELVGAQLVAPLLCEGWHPLPTPLVKPVLGIPEGPYLDQASRESLLVFEQNRSVLEKAGYEVREIPVLSDIEAISHRHQRLVSAEMARVHTDWFGQYAVLYSARTAAIIREGQSISYPEYDLYRASPRALRTELENVMDASGVDLWICPSATGAAPRGIDTTGDPAMNLPWTHAGLPVITLPAGRNAYGLPLGLQCVGRFWRDEDVLTWAGPLEQALTVAQ